MSMLATGKMAFNLESGLMTRPWFSLFALMYAQIFFVTSVRASFFAPQISAIAALNIFGAKIPLPAFFIAMAFFFPEAFIAVLPSAFVVAFSAFVVAFVIVTFVVLTVVAAVFVVVFVIAIREQTVASTSLE